jgi:hypothetical protein
MPDSPSSSDSAELSPEATALLRAGLAARDSSTAALPPVEPLLAKWNALHASAKPCDVVPFPDAAAFENLAMAARSGDRISAETRARLVQLVREMQSAKPPNDGR